jgi:hypothetical protein
VSGEKKLKPEELDYALAALSPILIIGMIGSLTFFFISLVYQGQYTVRLMYILGLYTLGSVLIARIAIEQSRTHSLGYMIALGAATLFVTPRFFSVQGSLAAASLPLLVLFLAVIAFLADRITFDCTSMNEENASSGIGLLQSLGLFRADRYVSVHQLQRRSLHSLQRRQKHNPGVWVLYLALLALPLFGAGQLFIHDSAARSFAFRMLFCYLFCSLSLLVIVALLSLRKYLRERGVPMELSFAARWLVLGGTVISLLLAIGMVLPIPSTSLFRWELPFQIKSRDDLQANAFGWGNEGVKNDQDQGDAPNHGDPSFDPKEKQSDRSADAANPGSSEAPDANKPKDQSNHSESKPSDRGASSRKKTDSSTAEQSQNGSNQTADDSASQQEDSDSSSEDNRPNKSADRSNEAKPKEQSKPNQQGKAPEGADPKGKSPNGNPQNQAADNQPRQVDQKGAEKQHDTPENPPREQPAEQPRSTGDSWSIDWNLVPLLQWILVAILVLIAIVYGVIYYRQLWNLLRGWFASKDSPSHSNSSVAITELKSKYPPFSSLRDPFTNRHSNEEVVRQMFYALEVWGNEQRIVRNEEDTPDEYVHRIGRRFPEQQSNLIRLGHLYSRIAYARRSVTAQELHPLPELWIWLHKSNSPLDAEMRG